MVPVAPAPPDAPVPAVEVASLEPQAASVTTDSAAKMGLKRMVSDLRIKALSLSGRVGAGHKPWMAVWQAAATVAGGSLFSQPAMQL